MSAHCLVVGRLKDERRVDGLIGWGRPMQDSKGKQLMAEYQDHSRELLIIGYHRVQSFCHRSAQFISDACFCVKWPLLTLIVYRFNGPDLFRKHGCDSGAKSSTEEGPASTTTTYPFIQPFMKRHGMDDLDSQPSILRVIHTVPLLFLKNISGGYFFGGETMRSLVCAEHTQHFITDALTDLHD